MNTCEITKGQARGGQVKNSIFAIRITIDKPRNSKRWPKKLKSKL